jgi:hypothetical protein
VNLKGRYGKYGADNDCHNGVDDCKDRWRNLDETLRVRQRSKDREAKQKIDEILDSVRDLKQSASQLEDENRDLREKLRFKSSDYEFRTPFWYGKAHPDQPLCPKCFASETAAPMGEPGQGVGRKYRQCLVCSHNIEVDFSEPQQARPPGGGGGPYGWMR